MNKNISIFYSNREKEDYYFDNILTADFKDIPVNKGGVYILVAKHESFLYPNKQKSKVFYIGMSKNLKNRLKTHQKWTSHLTEKPDEDRIDLWYWERYQYGASFGTEVCVFLCHEFETPKSLEFNIIEHFYEKYLGKPIANGAFSFKQEQINLHNKNKIK